MRRAIPVIAATGGALALLANFHTTPGDPAGAARASTTTTGPTAPSSTRPATSTTGRSATSTTISASPPTTLAPDTDAPPFQRTIDGPTISTEWGDVQVRVSLSGTKIVDVVALKLPSDRARSRRISEGAEPLLRNEVLQAQTTRVDTISGATVTSEGYLTSLQNALG